MNRARPFHFGKLLLASAALAGLSLASLANADTLDEIKKSNSVRIGYANSTEVLRAGLARISEFLAKRR